MMCVWLQPKLCMMTLLAGNAAICLQDKVQAILDKAMFQPSPLSTASLQVCCLLLMLVCGHALLHVICQSSTTANVQSISFM